MSKVIILGAKGRFGRAATRAFLNAGWTVTVLARAWDRTPMQGAKSVTCDVTDVEALKATCAGHDVIVNAVNPAYELWKTQMPRITPAVIAAARHTGATVLIPGNVYNYGAGAPTRITEQTPWQPSTRKGALRVTMENAYRDAGVRTIVVRAGDFFEREKSDGWFDMIITAKSQRGKTVYPGPLDRVHAWAYLPDLARAAVMLAEKRDSFAPFEEFLVEGYSITGAELVEAIAQATGKAQRVSGMPWWAMRLLGLVRPTIREVMEMRYLWDVPHRLDSAKLAQVLPDFAPTPLNDAMAEVLAA